MSRFKLKAIIDKFGEQKRKEMDIENKCIIWLFYDGLVYISLNDIRKYWMFVLGF